MRNNQRIITNILVILKRNKTKGKLIIRLKEAGTRNNLNTKLKERKEPKTNTNPDALSSPGRK